MFNARVYDLATRLKRARRAKGLTQIEVSRALGFSAALISNLERGLLPHRLQTIRDYGALLGLDLNAIEADLVAVRPALADLRPALQHEAYDAPKSGAA